MSAVRRGIVPFDVLQLGGFVLWTPDGSGQAVRFPNKHRVLDAAVKDGELLLLIEGEQMPEIDESEAPPRVRCIVSSGWPIAEFKKEP